MMMVKNIRGIYSLLFILSLSIGLLIYLLFRDLSNMIIFTFIPKPAFANTTLIRLKPSFFSSILMFNLPDMFWFLSGILLLRFIWFYKIKIQQVYIVGFYGMGAFLELSQLSSKVPGTFDLLDFLFMGTGAFMEALIYYFFVKRKLIGVVKEKKR